MREVSAKIITDAVRDLAVKTNYELGDDVKKRIHECRLYEIDHAIDNRSEGLAADILGMIEDNIHIAENEHIPLCQDTGFAWILVEMGQDVHVTDGLIGNAVNEGVRQGYKEGYLRKSIVADPLRRQNTQTNTPARIVYEMVPGDEIKITFAPKGFGSENMSRIKMLAPAAGENGIKDFIEETVRLAGGNPCPPVVVGVGIGSTFDGVALLAKKALLLPVDEHNEDPFYAEMEREMLERINNLNIGPQGFGGCTTALGVRIIAEPTHIAGMPVAVNINCHVSRHDTVII